MQWDTIDSIDNAYESLGNDIAIQDKNIEDYEIKNRIKSNYNISRRSFVKAVRDNLIDEEVTKMNNWCEHISKFMKNLATAVDGELVDFESRKRSRDSLESKYNNMKTPEYNSTSSVKALKKAFDNINDNIRYTILFDEDNYTEKFNYTQKLLKSKKVLETIRVRNTWNGHGADRGINTLVKCIKDGKEYVFEIQFHTKESLNARKSSEELYKIIKDDSYSKEQRKEADDKQFELYNSLGTPNGALEIANFG